MMEFYELGLLAVGLSMDAFAVAVCKGMALEHLQGRHFLIPALYFGGFQALMPLLGYGLGAALAEIVSAFSGWIAFGVLTLIGAGMIWEAGEKEERESDGFDMKTMLPLAAATSMDALAVGVSFALLRLPPLRPALLIGTVTALISALGIFIGRFFGSFLGSWAERFGGGLLILLGVRILFQNL